MHSANHDILILKRGEALSAKILEALLQKGYRTQVSAGAAVVAQELKSLPSPILVVDCGEDEEHAYEVVKGLIGSRELHAFPLIAVGKDTDAYEKVLQRYFKVAVTLVIPFSVDDIARAADFAFDALDKQTPPAPTTSAALSEAQATEAEKASEALAHELYKQVDDIPDLVFMQFGKLRLFERTLEGARYPRPIDEQKLRSVGLYPREEKLIEPFEAQVKLLGKWGRGHVFRVLYLSSRLAEGVAARFATKELVTTPAQLYPWSFSERDKELLRRDYLGSRGLLVRKDFCSKLKDSAMKISVELGLAHVGRVVALMAKQAGREEVCADTEEGLAANVIVSADLIDRMCFREGFWNPAAAYSLLRKLKGGKIKEFHPAILACAIKLLAEAITSSPTVILPRRIRENPQLVAEAERLSSVELLAHEVRVPLTELRPGMRLSRPVVAFDGRELLAPDLLLDQDLIWRLWQLSAVRPINGPLIVRASD